jgi:hypothetical protein
MDFARCFTSGARAVSVAVFKADPKSSGFLTALNRGQGCITCTLLFYEVTIVIEAAQVMAHKPHVFTDTFAFEGQCGSRYIKGYYRFAIGNETHDMGEIRLYR